MKEVRSWKVIKKTDDRCRGKLSIRVSVHVNGVYLGAEKVFSNSMLWRFSEFRYINGEEIFRKKFNEIMQDTIRELDKRLTSHVEEHCSEFLIDKRGRF